MFPMHFMDRSALAVHVDPLPVSRRLWPGKGSHGFFRVYTRPKNTSDWPMSTELIDFVIRTFNEHYIHVVYDWTLVGEVSFVLLIWGVVMRLTPRNVIYNTLMFLLLAVYFASVDERIKHRLRICCENINTMLLDVQLRLSVRSTLLRRVLIIDFVEEQGRGVGRHSKPPLIPDPVKTYVASWDEFMLPDQGGPFGLDTNS